jgi:hypothetical protein
MTTTLDKRKTTREIIWQAITDLHNAEQTVTRKTLQELTGLKFTTIDEHVDKMVNNDGCLIRLIAGVFRPVFTPPPARAISTTYMPDGMCLVEVGDVVLHLWPREARILGGALAGHAIQQAQIQLGFEMAAFNAAKARETA